MAFTLNGIGTRWYGRRDFRTDGTYVTTEWFVVLYVPIVPLRSLRMKYKGMAESRWFPGWYPPRESFAVYEKTLPNWKQVLYTYAYLAFYTAWVYLIWKATLAMFPRAFHTALGVIPACAVCLIPAAIPELLRFYAVRKLRMGAQQR